MKEELYLLFKSRLEPRLAYLRSYLEYRFRGLLNYRNTRQLSNSRIRNRLDEGSLVPLAIGYSPLLEQYLSYKDRMIFLDAENWKEYVHSLDPKLWYLIIGNEEHVNYLKKLNFKIVIDGDFIERYMKA
ncbi:hypothetical protein HF1_14310 [Mycoplasma haemofelis str. Langford 1]|uniref:Uncharacterized protein n=2 Tax=Mycoplasma haemofelis TaxID=29501 RepID=F6FH26_MYCHI|nr:hypothetical protein [Mycoplasma haemofelis]AEG73735.1 hypothetical protein MHF_1501 [Mycoplasma haemofelis Ohio2]CBY93439.1 hypothetical protein HF1_14310 [Mycoplasma haemofelis str. Langford 1]